MTRDASASWRSGLLRIGGSVAILAILAMLVPVDEVVDQIRRVSAATWLTAFTIFMVVQLIGGLKFHLVLHSAGVDLPVALSLRCYFAALFGNVFLPSIVGGDVISIGLAMRYSGNRAGVALGILVNRLLDFMALACMTVLGTGLLHATLNAESRRLFWTVAGTLSAIAVLAGLTAALLVRRRYSFRVRRWIGSLRRAARAMRRRRGLVLVGFMIGMAIQTILVVLVAWLGRSAGLDLSTSIWFFAWPLSKLAALAPVTIGGIGAREAAFASLLIPFGVPAARTVAVGLLYEAVSITGGLMSGLISSAIARRAIRSAT